MRSIFSTAALTDALSREVADPSVPVAQRMANLLQLAARDFSYRRFDAALEKYGLLYEYDRDPPLPLMQVPCLQERGVLRASPGSGSPARAAAPARLLEHELAENGSSAVRQRLRAGRVAFTSG